MTVQELKQKESDLYNSLRHDGYKWCRWCAEAGTRRQGDYAWTRCGETILLCDECVPKCEHKDCGNVMLLGTQGNCAEHEELENRAYQEGLVTAEQMSIQAERAVHAEVA